MMADVAQIGGLPWHRIAKRCDHVGDHFGNEELILDDEDPASRSGCPGALAHAPLLHRPCANRLSQTRARRRYVRAGFSPPFSQLAESVLGLRIPCPCLVSAADKRQ